MNDLELINPNISENGISKFIFLRPITLQQNQPDKPNIFELTYSMNMIEKEEQQCKNRKLAFNFKELQGSNNFKHKFVFKSLIKNIQEDDEKAQVLATLIYKSGEEKIQHNICGKIDNTELDTLIEQPLQEPYYLWGISFPNTGLSSLKRKKTNLSPLIEQEYIEFYDITKLLINDENFINKHLLTITPSDSDRIFTYKTIETSYTPVAGLSNYTKGIHAYMHVIYYITNIFGFDINNIFTTVFLKKLLLKNTDKNIKLIFKIEEEDEGLLGNLINSGSSLIHGFFVIADMIHGKFSDAGSEALAIYTNLNKIPIVESNRLTDEEIAEFKKSGISETLIKSINYKQDLLDTYINKIKEKNYYKMLNEERHQIANYSANISDPLPLVENNIPLTPDKQIAVAGKSRKTKKSRKSKKSKKSKKPKRKTTKRKSRKSKR